MEVVKRSRKGETAISIARAFEVGKTQIQSIVNDQENVVDRWENGENCERKYSKPRKCPYADLNEQVWKWFCDARQRNIPVSGKLIQEKAVLLSVTLGHDDFTASNGWLYKWMKRNNIHSSALSGDRAEVSHETVDDWIKRVPSICEGYETEDIFNCDETGLYFRAMPTKSMVVKGQDAAGVKTSKERFTVFLGASVTGEKLKPCVIGRSAKPRCFQGLDMASLGVEYYFNKKAWMTSVIFQQWANKLNNKMRIQRRKILVFIDNCSAHPPMQLSNVKFVMLPPNTTSRLQPLDAGIIQNVKLNYRKSLLRHILFEMEKDSTATGPSLAKSVNLLDAVLWLKKAWLQVKVSTITNCFVKCGFAAPDTTAKEPEGMSKHPCFSFFINPSISFFEKASPPPPPPK